MTAANYISPEVHDDVKLPAATGPMRRVLLIAYHFPPQRGSSGHLRSLKYSRFLPQNGWLPTVLTVHPRAYDQVDESQIPEIPDNVKVIRAFALDTQKHLSVFGRYPRWMALPDRWITWCLGAVPAGLAEIYRNKTELILSTFPVPSAVLIGYLLHRITRVPWVADFRDSMTEEDYPHDRRTRHFLRWLEKKAVRHASRLIFTAASARKMYLQRYPELSPEKCLVIANGYDEEDFKDILPQLRHSEPVRLLHSGLIYPEERNPVPFFQALSRLKREGKISANSLSVDLRACGNDELYCPITVQLGIDDIVHFLPPQPYRQALLDANAADALLLLQAANCDHQIPAKAYEYLRLRKPILALTTTSGDTAALLEECGGSTVMDIADQKLIYQSLPAFLNLVRSGKHALPRMSDLAKYSRQNQARELAGCLSQVVGQKAEAATVQPTAGHVGAGS